MIKRSIKWKTSALLMVLLLGVTGCSAGPTEDGSPLEGLPEGQNDQVVIIEDEPVPGDAKPVLAQVLVPQASGAVVYSKSSVTIDASNTSKGYIMVKSGIKGKKVKVQISKTGGTTYTYNISAQDRYDVFPLTDGTGAYTVNVYENVEADRYVLALGQSVQVKLENSYLPFLYPNQYVSFTDSSACVALAAKLAQKQTDDLGTLQAVYEYVVKNIAYDKEKAATVQSGYLPNTDATLASKKGICFDYAALMTAMLRSQNIPSKLVVGYSGSVYHAWINVYLSEVGWVDSAIYFDGTSWKLMDPTFASGSKNSDAIKKYIGDGANYKAKYTY